MGEADHDLTFLVLQDVATTSNGLQHQKRKIVIGLSH